MLLQFDDSNADITTTTYKIAHYDNRRPFTIAFLNLVMQF